MAKETGNPGSGWTPIFNRVFDEDPNWLKHDFEFLWAREYFDALWLKTTLRKYGMLQLEIADEDIPEYQEKIIGLFEKVPIFMSSQVIDSKKDAPLYEDKYLQENAF